MHNNRGFYSLYRQACVCVSSVFQNILQPETEMFQTIAVLVLLSLVSASMSFVVALLA